MFKALSAFDVIRVIKAKRLDQNSFRKWAAKHGRIKPDGSLDAHMFDFTEASLLEPEEYCLCYCELRKLSTEALEELQTLMYLGREGFGSDEKVPRAKAWAEACECYGLINKGNHTALLHQILEKKVLEHYVKDGLSYLPLKGPWKDLFFQLDPWPPSPPEYAEHLGEEY